MSYRAATQDLQGEDLKKALLDPLSEASAGVQKALNAPGSSAQTLLFPLPVEQLLRAGL